MTKADFDAWRQRWKIVNQLDLEELRLSSLDTKLRQLAALMASVDFLGCRDELEKDDPIGYDRWRKLRAEYARRNALHA